jgi:hypothetical protein
MRSGDPVVQTVAELGAHIRHDRPLQRQRLLGGQPLQPKALKVAAVPGGDDRAGGRLGVDADLGPGVGGPGPQLQGEVGQEHQLIGRGSGAPVSRDHFNQGPNPVDQSQGLALEFSSKAVYSFPHIIPNTFKCAYLPNSTSCTFGGFGV